MEENIQPSEIDENWYYVIVQNPGASTEQFVGFSDSKTEEKFIPVFKSKPEATSCFALLPKDLFNGEYGVQAVIEDDLLNVAKENGHKLYLLDSKGAILDTIN